VAAVTGPAERAILRLAVRSLWRGVAAVVLGAALMLQVIVSSFSAAFAGGAMSGIQGLVDNPAVKALYGIGYDLTTAGGFAVWRAGTFVLVVGTLWAVFATVRVLRGEEDQGRWDLLLAEPVSAGRAVGIHLAVLVTGCVLLGSGAAIVLIGADQPSGGALLYGTGVAAMAFTGVGVGALSAQLFGQRRRAAGIAGGVIGVFYVVRMLADASSGLGWLRWATPFGWVELLQAFAGDHLLPLVPLLVLPVALLAGTAWAYRRRDLGAGLLPDRDRVRARTRLLGGVVPFAWRQRLGGVVGWSLGLAFYGVIIGAITASFTDYIASNVGFQQFAAKYGIGELTSPAAFIGLMAGVVGVLLVLQLATSLRHGWEDESEGRLELYQSLPMTRSGWLAAEVGASAAAVVVAGLVSGGATWIGAAVGGADLTLAESLAAVANTAPVVVLFGGVAVLLHGIAPQLALPASAGLAVVTYFLAFLGPAANLSDRLVALSPFDHLASVPSEPVAWGAALSMAGVGVVLIALGFATYDRRDVA
jgi:ABC-2 type transport system permease protein